MPTISTRTHQGKQCGSKKGNSRGKRLLSPAWTRLPLQRIPSPRPGYLEHPSDKLRFSPVIQSYLTFCDPVDCSVPSFPVVHQLPELIKLMSIKSVMPSNHLILCRPLLLLPSIFPSIRIISNESVFHIRWPKCWSFSFSISLSNEHSKLISFRIDWLDLLEVQGILKSLLQHHGSKASILQCSAFFIVQVSHPYMTTGKTIALTRWTFVGNFCFLTCRLGWS